MTTDLIVVGGGISGLSLAHLFASAGSQVVVLERSPRLGGCLHSEQLESGFWFEMGAHTCYNSYGGLIRLIEANDQVPQLLARAKAPFRLLKDGQIKGIAGALNWFELLLNAPRILFTSKDNLSVEQYYSRIAGSGNYRQIVGPMLSAVPSQDAGGFPATMLFKKRPRRKDLPRSFTMKSGLQSIVDALGEHANIQVHTGIEVTAIEQDGGFRATAADGQTFAADRLAMAVPPNVAATLTARIHPELSATLGRIGTARVETVGVAVARSKLSLEPAAGIIPTDDLFRSAVTRDTVPHDELRGFAFHFRPGHTLERRLERITEVLGVSRGDLETVVEKTMELPSPAMGHGAIVAGIDGQLDGSKLFLTGNYFEGLAIEECVARSESEFVRFQSAH